MSEQSSVDVVIVGAGAAGLAAARTAAERGLSYVLLEAMDRIGGRAHTDATTFGVPWDRGCHWLHSASINPFTELADQYGFSYHRADPPYRAKLNGAWLDESQVETSWAFMDEAYKALFAAGADGRDVSLADVIDLSNPYLPMLRTALGGEWSVPFEQVSTVNHSAYHDTDENWPLKEGYGALVARHAEGVHATLSTPATRIRWGGPRVSVDTPSGTIDAGAVIVTVPTTVIQADLIAFDPPLPAWKREAYDSVRLGNANKVTFAIDGRHLGVEGHASLWSSVTERQGMYFQLRPFGYDMANGFLSGELGEAAEREGKDAILDTGRTALVSAYGSDILKHVTKADCTAWQSEPSILGAYGASRPGEAHKRADLATPIDDRLFFAGEATHPTFFTTCHGAHLSGIDAAIRVADVLRGASAGV